MLHTNKRMEQAGVPGQHAHRIPPAGTGPLPTCSIQRKHVAQVGGRHLAKRLGLLHGTRIIDRQLHGDGQNTGGAG